MQSDESKAVVARKKQKTGAETLLLSALLAEAE
jgi:hypothetical protein